MPLVPFWRSLLWTFSIQPQGEGPCCPTVPACSDLFLAVWLTFPQRVAEEGNRWTWVFQYYHYSKTWTCGLPVEGHNFRFELSFCPHQRWNCEFCSSHWIVKFIPVHHCLADADSLGCSSLECLGIHRGYPQSANLGDGHGAVNQAVKLYSDTLTLTSLIWCITDGTSPGLWLYNVGTLSWKLDRWKPFPVISSTNLLPPFHW